MYKKKKNCIQCYVNSDTLVDSVRSSPMEAIRAKHFWSLSLRTCGQPLCCLQWLVIACIKYSWYTLQTINQRILNVCTMDCAICLALTIMYYSNSDNSMLPCHKSLSSVHIEIPRSGESMSKYGDATYHYLHVLLSHEIWHISVSFSLLITSISISYID